MRARAIVALLVIMPEFCAAASAAEQAPLPGAFLEFLAEMIEEEGELLDPLLLAPPPMQGDATQDLDEPGARRPAEAPWPADSGDLPEPAANPDRSSTGATDAGAFDHV